ncbi:MAG TPA: CBS domain-containing protein [Steroidobacteraceae bacterium]|nr:CBS domain-containing protein [Steroidobacteraceae bacterium]
MKVGDICARNVVSVREFDELTAAARVMRERHVGYLVVVVPTVSESALKPVGVLTDRDIVVGVIARETDPRSLRVGDLMTRQPVMVDEDQPIGAALREMRRIGVRRIPVVDHSGCLVGVLSLDEIVGALSEELTDVAGSIRSEVRIEKALRP